MSVYIRDICLSPAGKPEPIDFDTIVKSLTAGKKIGFLEPEFPKQNVIKVTDNDLLTAQEKQRYIDELKKFHCDLIPDSPFSAYSAIRQQPVLNYPDLKIDIAFQEADPANAEVVKKKVESSDNSAGSQFESRPRRSTVVEIEQDGIRRRKRVRQRRNAEEEMSQDVAVVNGSTRLEAKRRRRAEGRMTTLRQTKITESEFLARRECINRQMIVREKDGLNQIAVLEDSMLVEHYVARHSQSTSVGNIYLGRVQNVLPSMEAAFINIGMQRNAVLYAGEVNWDELGMEGNMRRIENALKPGDVVLVQVTKDPIGHKGARLTSQITIAGRHIVLAPLGEMTGISKKLPEPERRRLKKVLRSVLPEEYGVIVRTAAEGATAQQLEDDVARLVKIWEGILQKQAENPSVPMLVHSEPELALRVIRDIFNEDFKELIISGEQAWENISDYVSKLSPELKDRLIKWTDDKDVFAVHRVDEQLAKGLDRKVWLPSGGYLIIDRTEAMTVIDVNTGKYIGSGGTLEETITKNNLESAEEIVRQLRLRDIGGIIVIDFVDMVLESNRNLVLRRLIECLGRDRTRHQVTEVTSLGLVQMTRKRVGQGLIEAYSTRCTCCEGRGYILHDAPVDNSEPEHKLSKKDRKAKRRLKEEDGSVEQNTAESESQDLEQLSKYKVLRKRDRRNLQLSKRSQEQVEAEHSVASEQEHTLSAETKADDLTAEQNAHRTDESVVSESADSNVQATQEQSALTAVSYLGTRGRSRKKNRRRVVSSGTISQSQDDASSIIIL